MKPLRSQLPCRSDAGNSGLLSAAEQVQASVTGLHHQFITGNRRTAENTGTVQFILRHELSVGGIQPVEITFTVTHHQIAVKDFRCGEITVQ